MSIIELIRKVGDLQGLNDAQHEAHETAYNNHEFILPRADLTPFTGDKDSQKLSLSSKEAAGLFLALSELILNVKRGFGVTPEKEIEDDESNADLALKQARLNHPQPEVTCRITLDTDTGKGRVTVTHPVVPGFSPEFDLKAARVRRQIERKGQGGIRSIETGFIHQLMSDGSLTHSELKTEDENVSQEAKVRKVWFEFQRTKKTQQ